jgi:hypothetical protein
MQTAAVGGRFAPALPGHKLVRCRLFYRPGHSPLKVSTMLSRSLACRILVAVGLLTLTGTLQAFAQGSETVVIASKPVARIRDKGPYDSVAERAASIDKAICEVISTQDTQHPKVSAKQSGGVWYVYSGAIKVMGVYAGDAKPNGVSVRDLAIQWANNVRQQLPRATPCSKLPRSAFLPKPGQVVKPLVPTTTAVNKPVEPAATGGEPTAAAVPDGAGAAAAPVATVPPATTAAPAGATVADNNTTPAPATAAVAATPTAALPRSASVLLILDAFNVVRNLSQEDYVGKRDEVASNLLANLASFVGEAQPGGSNPPALPTSTASVAASGTTSGPTAVAHKPKPAPKPITKPTVIASKPPKPGTSSPDVAGAAGSKVAQKNRIKAKFAQCETPFEAMRASDPATADQIGEILKAARSAFAGKNYDASEEYVDHALKLLGATPQQ